MIVEHLTKIYKSNGTNGVGLDDVSFALPDKGLVFIVGKSGSGKSTLLNMLGGLDEITSGDIIVGEKRFSEFTNSDFDDYRNSYLGFVFQDFCLINELTIADNVRLALDFQGNKHTDDKVADILEKVELTEYAHRKPTQLSGGQRQRVAIARALVKEPKLILADEPTGNLDSKTAVQVLELLKKLSEETLILVVSHNVADAEKYADRLIELADGKIVKDVSKNECHDNTFAVDGDTVYLPDRVRLTDEEIEVLNKAISSGDKKVVQRDTAFTDTKEVHTSDVNTQFISSKLSIKRTLDMSGKFMRKKLITSILMTVLITAVVVLFGLSRVFVDFDGAAAMNDAMQTSTDAAFVMNKGYVSRDIVETLVTNNVVGIADEEIDKFYETGYSGKIYKKYATCMPIAETSYNIEGGLLNSDVVYRNFYCSETRGTLLCDEAFLTKVFGIDGTLNVICGDLYASDGAVIITDYVADSILHWCQYLPMNSSYEDILRLTSLSGRGRVCAVIKTDYKERFSDYIEKIQTKQIIDKQTAAEFQEYAENYLAVTYTFDNDFTEHCVASESFRHGFFRNSYLQVDDTTYNFIGKYVTCVQNDEKANECEIAVSVANEIFGTAYTSSTDESFVPFTATFYIRGYGSEYVYSSFTLEVTGLVDSGSFVFHDKSLMDEVQRGDVERPYALYFDNYDNISEIYDVGTENDFYSATAFFKTVQSITKIVSVFKDIFSLIAIGLCGVMILLMAFFAFSNIRSRSYEIGVMKAMGARTRNVAGIFLVQVICVGLSICLLFGLFFYFGMPFANKLLMDSLIEYVENASIGGITLLSFDSGVMWTSIAMVLGVTAVSSLMPFLGVMTIKPANIIKSRE